MFHGSVCISLKKAKNVAKEKYTIRSMYPNGSTTMFVDGNGVTAEGGKIKKMKNLICENFLAKPLKSLQISLPRFAIGVHSVLERGHLLLHVFLDSLHKVLGVEEHALLDIFDAMDAAREVLGHLAAVDTVDAGGLKGGTESEKEYKY